MNPNTRHAATIATRHARKSRWFNAIYLVLSGLCFVFSHRIEASMHGQHRFCPHFADACARINRTPQTSQNLYSTRLRPTPSLAIAM